MRAWDILPRPQPLSRSTGREQAEASMIRKYVLPLVAVRILFFAVYHVVLSKPPKLEPPVQPSPLPFRAASPAPRIVEAETENAVGSALRRRDKVRPRRRPAREEALLFSLDDRQPGGAARASGERKAAPPSSVSSTRCRDRKRCRPPGADAGGAGEPCNAEDQYKRARRCARISQEEMVHREQAPRRPRAVPPRRADFKLLRPGRGPPTRT